jgi:hypothetical protein
MRPSPRDLIERLMELEGVSKPKDLAKKTGLDLRQVQRWRAGQGMDYDTTLDLLDRVGALNWEEEASALDPEVVALGELLVQLEQVLPRLHRRLVHQAHPTRPQGRTGSRSKQ